MSGVYQLGVREYMNANHPSAICFNDSFTPFKYGGVWFYPVASRPASKRFNELDSMISYSKWCEDFSKSVSYNLNDFYRAAQMYGYGKCDVFATRVGGKIRYLIPTDRILAKFPLGQNERNQRWLLRELEERLNKIFDDVL